MDRSRRPLRWLLTLVMVGMGITHFLVPRRFAVTIPRFLPAPMALVYISGVCEILGGLGLAIARTRRAAAIGLALLYVAVWPANINMALHGISPTGVAFSPFWLWARVPFQGVFVLWALWYARE